MKYLILFLAAVLFLGVGGCSSESTNSSSDKGEKVSSNQEKSGSVSEEKSDNQEEFKSVESQEDNQSSNQITDNNDNQSAGDGSDQAESSNNISTSNQTNSIQSQENDNEQDSQLTSSSDTNSNKTKKISSGDEAVVYLKSQIPEGENDDIVFDDMGGTLSKDDKGSYYTITLYSKELKKDGGSGTVGSYKVYQNGTYTEN